MEKLSKEEIEEFLYSRVSEGRPGSMLFLGGGYSRLSQGSLDWDDIYKNIRTYKFPADPPDYVPSCPVCHSKMNFHQKINFSCMGIDGEIDFDNDEHIEKLYSYFSLIMPGFDFRWICPQEDCRVVITIADAKSQKAGKKRKSNLVLKLVSVDDFINPDPLMDTTKASRYTSKNSIESIRNKIADKRKVDYYVYIRSPEWKKKSDAAKLRSGFRCQVCNRSSWEVKLNTHHRTYRRLGVEMDEDLTVLCEDCHKDYHDKGRIPSPPK